jgi:hypothetical protein
MTNAASAPIADTPLTAAQSAILDLVLDLIVPPSAERRLPGAAELGVPAYLAAQASDALPLIGRELDALEARKPAASTRKALPICPRRSARRWSIRCAHRTPAS